MTRIVSIDCVQEMKSMTLQAMAPHVRLASYLQTHAWMYALQVVVPPTPTTGIGSAVAATAPAARPASASASASVVPPVIRTAVTPRRNQSFESRTDPTDPTPKVASVVVTPSRSPPTQGSVRQASSPAGFRCFSMNATCQVSFAPYQAAMFDALQEISLRSLVQPELQQKQNRAK